MAWDLLFPPKGALFLAAQGRGLLGKGVATRHHLHGNSPCECNPHMGHRAPATTRFYVNINGFLKKGQDNKIEFTVGDEVGPRVLNPVAGPRTRP